jgi:hypothetical protein
MSSENTDFKSMITKVIELKKYIDTVVNEIQSGEYNPEIIKILSTAAEDILGMEKSEHKFKPKAVVVDNISDTESDVEMDDDDDGPQFADDTDDLDAEFEKLQELINRRPAIVKKTDKLAEEFLNNTISYSKNIHNKCDFYKSCISY